MKKGVMTEDIKLAGFRIIQFSADSKESLKQIAERLIPHHEDILNGWMRRQWRAWAPPGISQDDLRQVFNDLQTTLFTRMRDGELDQCVSELGDAGARLADRAFPFEALIISIHFLEESYMPYLLRSPDDKTCGLLIAMDEFLHAALAAIATSYFETYRKTLLDQAEVGRIAQEGLLASIPRKAADLEIAHVYISARDQARLGGDFLDFFTVDRGGLAFLIGDLSGHGLEAAADSVKLRSLFRGFMRENPEITDAMGRVNRVLYSELDIDQFATALAITYDMDGTLKMVSAGHPYPIVCDDTCRYYELNGCALAVDDGSVYTSCEDELRPGAVLVAFTDGVIEAKNGHDTFGEDRIRETVAEIREAPARAIADHLIDEALRFGGGKFTDDVAVLVLKRRRAI